MSRQRFYVSIQHKPKNQTSSLWLLWLPNFRQQADAVFTVSSGTLEKIQFILLILS
jgi:hypothetical protein